jgi:serine/threonine-protein kinase
MGEVYRTKDLQLKRDVALKVLPAAVATDADRLARFQREAELLAALNHPHIAQIYGVTDHDGVRALVIELVEGETLAERLARGAMPVAEALPLAQQLADALDYAHERGIVHRDLKPANIKVTPDGAVKVLDFGLAKALAPDPATSARDVAAANSPTMTSPAMTQAGVILGTAAYMSPEQARGKPVDKRADIWAVGVVLFEMLTGRVAFPGETITDVIAGIVQKEPDWAQLPADVPARVRDLIRRCLQKDPRARLRDIGDARIELAEWGRLDAEGAGPDPRTVHGGRPAWRHPLTMSAGVLGLTSIAVAAWFAMRPPAAPTLEPRHFELGLPASAPVAFAGPAPMGIWQRAVAISRDGKTVAYIARKGDTTGLVARYLDTGLSHEFDHTDAAYFPFFSPDGQWIAFLAGGELKKVPASGGEPTVITTEINGPAGATWTSQNQILVQESEGGKPTWLEAFDSSRRPIAAPCYPTNRMCTAEDPHVLPGGEWAIGVSGAGVLSLLSLTDKGIFVLSRDGPVPFEKAEPDGSFRGSSPRYLASGYLISMSPEGTDMQAMSFDPATLRVTGQPFPVIRGIRQEKFYTSGQFAISEEGTLVYASGADAESSRLAWVDRAGYRQPVDLEAGAYHSLSFDPDGKLASLMRRKSVGGGAELLIVDVHTGRLVQSVEFARAVASSLWKPHGGLFVTTMDMFVGALKQRTMSFASVTGQPTDVPDLLDFPTAVSGDGAWMAFTLVDEQATLRSLRDPKAPPISIAPAGWSASFSPDSHWLAFTEYGSVNKIVVIPIPYNGQRFLVASDEGDLPRWFRDGRRLAYKRGREIMVIDLTFKDGKVEPGKPRRFAEGPFPRVGGWSYDIGPDDRVLTFVNADEKSADRLHIVTNFGELVRRKAIEAAGQPHAR